MNTNPDSAIGVINKAIGKIPKSDKIYPFFLLQLGDCYRLVGNYDSSYVKYIVALELFEKHKYEYQIAEVKLNIGILYDLQHDPSRAVKQYHLAKNDFIKINDAEGLIKTYMNLGISFKNIGLNKEDPLMLDSAFYYYNKAEYILNRQNDNPLGLTKLYINIGNLKYTQQVFVEAIFYYKKALKIAEENNYSHELALVYDNLGWAYQNINDNQTALIYANKGLKLAEKLNSKYNKVNSLSNISRIYYKLNNFKEAYGYLDRMVMVNDSLINETTIQLQNELQSKYESEKKDKEIALLNVQKEKEAALSSAEQKKKNIIIVAIAMGLLIVLIFSFFLYKRFILTKKQKAIIDQKNKDITDSINYAKRIQTALLKEEEHISENLPDHFILFLPKDIVSGDFYWTHQKQDILYLAAADCTGHGVPGAFLTMLGTAFLNEITAEENILAPAEILNELRRKFINELSQTGEIGVNKDGMDISIISLNLKTNELNWAGANNPLWIITKNKNLENVYSKNRNIRDKEKTLVVVNPDKQPIAFHMDMTEFTDHKIQLSKGDSIFIFSDGYADQFGGKKGKKFMYKTFKELLLSVSENSMESQKELLQEAFFNWKGNYDQVDDVCVIGLRV